MSKRQTPESFWARVAIGKPDECWLWRGAHTSSGYGNLSWHCEHVQAHRVAWFLTHGGINLLTGFRLPGVAKRHRRLVLHRCDVRDCCNPAHLFLGSMRANQLDAYAKGRKRQPRGEYHANAKLTTAQAKEIRERYGNGGIVRQVDLAAQYGVSQRVISLIVRGESYR